MWYFVSACLAGINNAGRGRGFIPVWLFSLFFGLINCANGSTDAWINVVVFAVGIAIWKAPGWSLYFSAFHGMWHLQEHEVKWIDKIGLKLVPFVATDDINSNSTRGALCMAIRGAAYILPLFLVLAYLKSPFVMLLWPFTAVQGMIYGAMLYMHGTKQVPTAEFLTHFWFQLLFNIISFL